MAAFSFDDLRRAIKHLEGIRQPKKVEIKTGSLDNFMAALERHTGPLQRFPQDQKSPVASLVFSGCKVSTHEYLPVDRAVLMVDGEVVQIIDLNAEPAS